jgi:hypothetical protein
VIKEKDFLTYSYSSFPDFLRGESHVLTLDPILSQFSSPVAYKNFVLDQVGYARTLDEIKHLALED